MLQDTCFECQKTSDETQLSKCPTCHKRFCDDHAHRMSGRWFCSRGCAQHFFFAEPDPEDVVPGE